MTPSSQLREPAPARQGSAAQAPDGSGEAPRPAGRLQSLDAYRGLIMVALAFSGFGLAGVASELKDSSQSHAEFWNGVAYHFGHVEWVGCAFWDLIQPSFMFMVGVSLPYSYGARRERGDSWLWMLLHALRRSAVLILLGIFLISNGKPETWWMFTNVLTQIGLGYPFLFLLWGLRPWVQALAGAALLAGTWLLYWSYSGAGLDPAQGDPAVGVTAQWAQEHLEGVPAAWHKNANAGHAIDVWLLNRFPRAERFEDPAKEWFAFNPGGYATINFVPELATMIFGLLAGELLRSALRPRWKLLILLAAGLAGLAAGEALHMAGLPMVKRLWTPSFALFSTGWCLLILATLYCVIDIWQLRRWSWPLIVVGVNSILIYSMEQILDPWTKQTYKTHLGPSIFSQFGPWAPLVEATAVGLFYWLICYWLYRRKLFIRI